MEQSLNFEYRDFKTNGFIMLFSVPSVVAPCIRVMTYR